VIQLKRVYDPPVQSDGQRILVERLWPRGMKKESLAADSWMKEVAPSTELRKWFGHRVERWEEFRRRYWKELDANPDAWEPILVAGECGTVTLLYSAHDALHNSALVLRDYLAEREVEHPTRGNRAGSGAAREGPKQGAARRGGRTHGDARRRSR
jgi:uncharacterized protein YeaO (DUF488 family)